MGVKGARGFLLGLARRADGLLDRSKNSTRSGREIQDGNRARRAASKIYDQGLAKLANGAPKEAAKKFTDLGKQYPSSDWARKGLLMTTYAHYTAGEYADAETAAERYVKEYPKSPEAAYALYLEASSYYAQILDISRDQDRAVKALELSRRSCRIIQIPNMSTIPSSRSRSPRDQLAGKEMSIGRFYLNRRNYTAAINRFRAVPDATIRPPGTPRRRSIG